MRAWLTCAALAGLAFPADAQTNEQREAVSKMAAAAMSCASEKTAFGFQNCAWNLLQPIVDNLSLSDATKRMLAADREADLALSRDFDAKRISVTAYVAQMEARSHDEEVAIFGRRITIARPDWAHKPAAQDMAGLYPAGAKSTKTSGLVMLTCAVTPQGAVENCTVGAETPKGLGFADAALQLSKQFLMKPLSMDGVAVGGSLVTIPVEFKYSFFSRVPKN